MGKERGNFVLAENQDCSADFSTDWIVVSSLDCMCIGVSLTSTDLKGTLYIEGAVCKVRSTYGSSSFEDIIEDTYVSQSVDVTVTLKTKFLFNIADLASMLIRVRYVADVDTPGTGTALILGFGKSWS